MRTEVAAHRRRFPDLGEVASNFGAVFADPKTIFGIKLGLAGILALYISRLIRLEHANWALFTVLVLAPAQYVGAIGSAVHCPSYGYNHWRIRRRMAGGESRTRSGVLSGVRFLLHFLLHVHVWGLDFPLRLFSVR